MRNGYKMVYKPEHHRADSTGCVYEHILVAEETLGRRLKKEECVHHLNEIRNDNRTENLIVFKTVADHTAFHMGATIILKDDVYVALPNQKSVCPICGKTKDYTAKTCVDCWHVLNRKTERPSKDELQRLILNTTFTELGKRFGVSDNTIRKWCKNYGLTYKYKELHPKKEKPESNIINDAYRIKMINESMNLEFDNINIAIDYLFNKGIVKSAAKRYTVRDNIVRAFKKEKKYHGYNWLIYK